MISLLITVFAIILLMIAIMSIGVIVQKKPLQGSCGGVNRLLSESSTQAKQDACPICGRSTSCSS